MLVGYSWSLHPANFSIGRERLIRSAPGTSVQREGLARTAAREEPGAASSAPRTARVPGGVRLGFCSSRHRRKSLCRGGRRGRKTRAREERLRVGRRINLGVARAASRGSCLAALPSLFRRTLVSSQGFFPVLLAEVAI